MKLSLGFSPCPNDTFIFDALVNKKIDTEGFDFDVHLEDVQTLNEWAKEGKLHITKISYGVLPLIQNEYVLLNSGGALGRGVGPLLISNSNPAQRNLKVEDCVIAIPGENTTAHFLFSLAYPHAKHKVFMRFDEIENFVLNPPLAITESGLEAMGVIIHENRFTYQQKGLLKVIDLGDDWERKTGSPIPLGGIVCKQHGELALKINSLIRKSLEYAFAAYPFISDYVKQHSQEMSEDVMRQHIDLYVNDYSLDLGKNGKAAVIKLMQIFEKLNPGLPVNINNLFLETEL